jgi:hypothetical protein
MTGKRMEYPIESETALLIWTADAIKHRRMRWDVFLGAVIADR